MSLSATVFSIVINKSFHVNILYALVFEFINIHIYVTHTYTSFVLSLIILRISIYPKYILIPTPCFLSDI